MRRFIYKLSTGAHNYSDTFSEEDVKSHKRTGLFGGSELFELTPRAVKTVTIQEIV